MSDRYCLKQDDDCHWYLIPVLRLQNFEEWLAAGPYYEDYEGEEFDSCRIDGPHRLTFTDPKEE